MLAKNYITLFLLVLMVNLFGGCANTPEGESARRGAGYGAAGGAVNAVTGGGGAPAPAPAPAPGTAAAKTGITFGGPAIFEKQHLP